MGCKAKRARNPAVNETLWSLPGLQRRTTQSPPEDLAPEDWVEVSTGEDTPRSVMTVGHTIIGLVFWAAWLAWTIYVWFFTGTPITDLWIVLLVWFITFLMTIIGVPVMRRKARNRVAQ